MATIHQGALFGPEKEKQTRRGNAFKPKAAPRIRIIGISPNQESFDLDSFQMNSMGMNLGVERFFFNMGPVLVAGPGQTGRSMAHGGDFSDFFSEEDVV